MFLVKLSSRSQSPLCKGWQTWLSGFKYLYNGFRDFFSGFRDLYRGFIDLYRGFRELYRGFRDLYHRFRELYRRFINLYRGFRDVNRGFRDYVVGSETYIMVQRFISRVIPCKARTCNGVPFTETAGSDGSESHWESRWMEVVENVHIQMASCEELMGMYVK